MVRGGGWGTRVKTEGRMVLFGRGDPPVTARSLHRSLQVVVSGLQRELGPGDVRREIAEVGKLSGSCGFEGRYHIGTLAMFSNTGRGESGVG